MDTTINALRQIEQQIKAPQFKQFLHDYWQIVEQLEDLLGDGYDPETIISETAGRSSSYNTAISDIIAGILEDERIEAGR